MTTLPAKPLTPLPRPTRAAQLTSWLLALASGGTVALFLRALSTPGKPLGPLACALAGVAAIAAWLGVNLYATRRWR